jgi:hypothetical protein
VIDTKRCLVCKPRNKTLYWHEDPDTGDLWCYCNKCNRGYSIWEYCHKAGINLSDFLKGDFSFEEAIPNEVQAVEWPARYIPLSDPRASEGVQYVESRGLALDGDMYYDIERNGIVFPYYFGNYFCGAQTRFIVPKIDADGKPQKMDTMPGTRLGLLFYGWNQDSFVGDVKNVVVTEGSFNALAIGQSFQKAYGGISTCPWRTMSCSGSGATDHHKSEIKGLKDAGLKVILAPDSDEAGLNMLKKFKEANAITHYALTGTKEDWNDVLKRLGPKEFAVYFLSRIKKI